MGLDEKALKELRSLTLGDLVCVEWFDASLGKSLGSGVVVDVPVKSWGIYIGVLGKRQKHVIVAQNYFEFSNGLYDLDYTAVPVSWAVNVQVVDKNHVTLEEAERLFTSFLRGGRRASKRKQEKVRNHEKLA